MGMAGSIFELTHPNFQRIHFFMNCKIAEIFVMISQVVSDIPKISVSQMSISSDVLGIGYVMKWAFVCHFKYFNISVSVHSQENECVGL